MGKRRIKAGRWRSCLTCRRKIWLCGTWAIYLSFAQINDNELRPEQGEQPRGSSFGERVRLVEHDLCDALAMVKDDLTTDMKHIAYHAHDAPTPRAGDIRREPLAGPDNRVVRQSIELRHHLLCCKTLLVAFGHPHALLIAFEGRFYPPAALSIAIHRGQQDGARGRHTVYRLPSQGQHLVGRQS